MFEKWKTITITITITFTFIFFEEWHHKLWWWLTLSIRFFSLYMFGWLRERGSERKWKNFHFRDFIFFHYCCCWFLIFHHTHTHTGVQPSIDRTWLGFYFIFLLFENENFKEFSSFFDILKFLFFFVVVEFLSWNFFFYFFYYIITISSSDQNHHFRKLPNIEILWTEKFFFFLVSKSKILCCKRGWTL